MNWNSHIESLCKKLSQANGILTKLRHYVSNISCVSVYYSVFYSHVTYGSLVWQFTSKGNLTKITNLQKKCIRLISFSDYNDHTNPLFVILNILKVKDVFEAELLKFFVKLKLGLIPASLNDFFVLKNNISFRETRLKSFFQLPSFNSIRYGKNSLKYFGALTWNNFYNNLSDKKITCSIKKFKKNFKQTCIISYRNEEQQTSTVTFRHILSQF